MTKKERIKAFLANQPVDRNPFAFLDGGAWAVARTGKTYREFLELEDAGASYIVDYFKEADVDMISASSAFAVAFLDSIGCKSDIDCSGTTVDVEKCIDDPDTDIPNLDKTKIP